jgi:hypothetical protein
MHLWCLFWLRNSLLDLHKLRDVLAEGDLFLAEGVTLLVSDDLARDFPLQPLDHIRRQ